MILTTVKSSQHIQEALKHLDDPELASTIREIIVNQTQQRAPYDLCPPVRPNMYGKNLRSSAQAHCRSMNAEMKKEFLKAFNSFEVTGTYVRHLF